MVVLKHHLPVAYLIAVAGLVIATAAPVLATEGARELPVSQGEGEHAGDRVVWEDFPLDDDLLVATDRKHRRELRRMANFCRQTNAVALRSKSGLRACVRPDLDRVIRESGNPQLIAYHWALPPVDRYNPERTSVHRARVAERARRIVAGEMEPPPFRP